MNIEEFQAAFIAALQPLLEFAKHVRDIFLEAAERLRKALAPLWKRAHTSLSQMRKGGIRKARRIAWKMAHEERRARRAPHRKTVLKMGSTTFGLQKRP